MVDRFRDAAAGADSAEVDGYVTVVWIGAALGAVLAVILFALFTALALGLRRGSNAARIGTWVVCGLGLLFGCGAVATVAVQRAGDGTPGTLGFALSEAYPGSWIGLNVGLAIAQMAGYLVVAVLLIAGPGTFFGRPGAAGGGAAVRPLGSGAYVALPTYGSVNTYPPAVLPTSHRNFSAAVGTAQAGSGRRLLGASVQLGRGAGGHSTESGHRWLWVTRTGSVVPRGCDGIGRPDASTSTYRRVFSDVWTKVLLTCGRPSPGRAPEHKSARTVQVPGIGALSCIYAGRKT